MKVGDYVRTKNKIYKIIDKKFDETILVDLFHIDTGGYLMKNDIIRSSPNIIDLIEVGDYVNGCWVNEIKNGKPFHEDYNDPYYSYYFDDIKSIVTKEQFESVEYKVEE